MRYIMRSWRWIARRLRPAASGPWTAAWLTRVRLANRWPVGHGEPELSVGASGPITGRRARAPRPVGKLGDRRRTVQRPARGCAKDAIDQEPKTVSYVVRRRCFVHGAGYMELDCSGRAVGDRETADPAVEGAAAGRRNTGHA